MEKPIDPLKSKRARDYATTALVGRYRDEYIRLNNEYRERMGLPMLSNLGLPIRPYIYKIKDIPQ